MKVKKFCATATLLAAACAMQAGALAAEAPAATGTATQSTVGAAVTATNQTASTDAATGELLPSDVQTSSDGLQLKKIYDVGKTTSPDKIPQADFERGGFKYTFEDLLKIELPEMDRKVHSETVTVSSSSNNTNDVLSLLPKSKSVSTTDGYTGTAYLDISSISTKVAGTESVSSDLSATREYPGCPKWTWRVFQRALQKTDIPCALPMWSGKKQTMKRITSEQFRPLTLLL